MASKFVLNQIPTFTLLFLRFLLAGIVLMIIQLNRKPQKIAREDYKYILFIGVFGYFMANAAQFFGTKFANASLASLINSINPVTIILFASIFLKEKFTLKKMISVSAAISGTYIILGGTSGSGKKLGIVLTILSVLIWSFTTIVARRINQKYDSLIITTYSIIIAAICSLPPAIYELTFSTNFKLVKPDLIYSVLYIGLVCTALTHYLWNKSLSMLDAGSCSLFYPLQPLTAALLGWLLLGEKISSSFILGAILIIGGVLFSIISRQKSRQPKAADS